jgi:hypothetical protein
MKIEYKEIAGIGIYGISLRLPGFSFSFPSVKTSPSLSKGNSFNYTTLVVRIEFYKCQIEF